jgi:acyl-CoA synthetase (NDP forming)
MSAVSNTFVLEPEAARLFSFYSIPYPEHGLADNPKQACEIAERLGYPVVLKVVSPDVLHKTDVGGVLVGLDGPKRVSSGYKQIERQVRQAMPDARIHGMLVCRQCNEGLEIIVGALQDLVFGPTVMVGLGGIFAEVFHDVSFRIAPLKRIDAEEMIMEMKGSPLLQGHRGRPARDVRALADLLLAVSQLVTEHPEITELDLNPVRLYEQGLHVLDIRLLRSVGS